MFKEFTKEIREEVELSNIRISSNDDVEYAVDVIDRLLDKLDSMLLSPRNPPQPKNNVPMG